MVDDGSADNTEQVVREISENIIYKKIKNSGPAEAGKLLLCVIMSGMRFVTVAIYSLLTILKILLRRLKLIHKLLTWLNGYDHPS